MEDVDEDVFQCEERYLWMIDDDRRGAMTREEGNGRLIQIDVGMALCFLFSISRKVGQ